MILKKRIEKELNKVTEEYRKQLDMLIEPERGLKNIKAFNEKAQYALNNLNPKIHVSFGNLKLPKTTMIVNLGTWFNCPGRRFGFCDMSVTCYDKAPEVMYKERTKDRLEQEIFWRACTAKEFAEEIINQINIRNNSTKLYKVKQIRWAEVGELRNQEDLEKLITITNIIGYQMNIKSYLYTHNKSLNFYSKELRPYLTINGSNFMVDNEYRIIKKNKKNLIKENHFKCICDCNFCNVCAHPRKLLIIEEERL